MNLRILFCFVLAWISSALQLASAQQTILISTQHLNLALQADTDSLLFSTYLGAPLNRAEEYLEIPSLDSFKPGSDDLFNQRLAYTTAGSLNLLEPALAVTHSDGDKSTVLKYLRHEMEKIDNNRTLTRIFLKDPRYDFFVTLFYLAYQQEDVIEQWTSINHTEKDQVILDKYASANLTLMGNAFFLKEHHSGWGKEMLSEEQQLLHGIKTLDSKLGTRNNLLLSSSFMLSLNEPTSEDRGEVIAGSLAWTGNFRIDFEPFDEYYVRITAGINNFASAYTLKPGETFTTPHFIYTYSNTGKGQASRNLHHWAQNYQIVDGNGERYTLLNNWETTGFNFDDKKLSDLILDTKKLGVDVFLLDDGWFGNEYPRNAPNAGLGDWQVNQQKLKDGLGTVIKNATENGVKFGLWLEPEMVNPASELYQKHPKWVIREPGRKEYYMRNQLVLDLCNPEVQDFIVKTVDGLLQQHPSLAFIKWDCNSLIYNAYSPYLKNQDHFYVSYVQGLYQVLERIRAKYPKVPMMLCAGGGSRVDYGALRYFTEFWPSDNTNPFDRIFMQWEYSYYFPAIAVDNHVTNMGKQSIKFKTDVAFMGKLGFDIRVNDLGETDLLFCQQAVKSYNSLKDLIWHGDQYRLQSPYDEKVASISYVSTDKKNALVCNYYMPTTFSSLINIPIKMKGLDPQSLYRIEEINLYPGTSSSIDSAKQYSGDFLMKVGFNPQVNARRSSVLLKVTAL